MNNLLDFVRSWSNRLTMRILKMSGASDAAVDNFVKATVDNNHKIIEADKELKNKIPIIKYIIYAALATGAFFLYKYLKKRRIIK